MKQCLLLVALALIFVGCSSTATTPTPTTPATVKSGYCPELEPATAQLKELVWTYREPPVYPRETIQQRLMGGVVMIVWVTPTGSVEQVCVVKSSPPGVFDAAAVQSMAKWRFKKRMVDGVSVPQERVQTIEFRVD